MPRDAESGLLADWVRSCRQPICPPELFAALTDLGQAPPSYIEGTLRVPILFARAHAQGIAPLLHASLARWGLAGGPERSEGRQNPGGEAFAPFALAHTATLRQNLLHLDELARVSGHLAEAGIECLALKGAALLFGPYSDPAERPMSDVDLLVRPRDVDAAIEAAGALGYALLRPAQREAILATNHEIELARTLSDGTRLYLEIHWRLQPREALLRGPDEEPRTIWRDALPARDHAIRARVPAPEDAIVLAALHLARHAYSRAIWLVDVALLAATPGLIWEDVITKARDWRGEAALHAALAGARTLCDAPVPEAVLARFAPGKARGRALDAILAWPDHFGPQSAESEHALSAERRYLLKLLLCRDTFAALGAVVRILLPSAAWLRARYAPGPGASGAAVRLRHLAAVLRLALAARVPVSPPTLSLSERDGLDRTFSAGSSVEVGSHAHGARDLRPAKADP